MKGGSSPRDKLLDDKDDLKVDLDSSFSHSHGKTSLHPLGCWLTDCVLFVCSTDLGSNDSYGTVVDMGLTVDSSPRHGHYLHGGSSTPPYISSSHSPPANHPGVGHQFPYHSDGLSVYTNLGMKHHSRHSSQPASLPPHTTDTLVVVDTGPGHQPGMMNQGAAGPPSDVSDASSAQGYPDFPPSPDSWLGESTAPRY
jgi:LIM homeobox protein 3/4